MDYLGYIILAIVVVIAFWVMGAYNGSHYHQKQS